MQNPYLFLVESMESYGDERREKSFCSRIIREGFTEEATFKLSFKE